jgi:hypothetical protein
MSLNKKVYNANLPLISVKFRNKLEQQGFALVARGFNLPILKENKIFG